MAVEHTGIWQDQHLRAANEKAGWKLCGHCNGTGNELYAMYRACPECGGSGQAGEPPIKVRLGRWWRERRQTWRDREWVAWLHWLASYYFGIGHWFRDGRDSCRVCECLPSDVDFEMRRVGPRRAECCDQKSCRLVVEENAKYPSPPASPKETPSS
jgi:hypothetical protein